MKPRGNRIACIYFPTSSVGGTNTACSTFRRAAALAGDTFDIICSPNQKTKAPRLFATPQLIRGGDTKITITGEASHHIERIDETVRWLERNYDGMVFLHPCPHPTKAYGKVPYWGALYERPKLPKVTRFNDGYYESYRWIDPYLRYCNAVFVNQPAYALPIQHLNPTLLPKPFLPQSVAATRSGTPSMVWTSQWKKIKGCWEFLRILPDLRMPVALYSNGIEYYYMRATPEWDRAVGYDEFEGKSYHGRKDHVFHGYVPLEAIPEALAAAWAMVDLQGYRSKYKAYTEGSYNNTTVEALWYGATPILHANAAKGPLPKECCVFVEAAEDIVPYAKKMMPMSAQTRKLAQEWVREHHHGLALYYRLREGLFK